jgi:hypothetical protein
MHSPAASVPRHVVRLAGALAELLGDLELPEDELLGWLREKGLITYPSPLLGRLLEELRDVFAAEVLPRLRPVDLALFAKAGPEARAAVVASGLRCWWVGGGRWGVPLKISHFVGGSVQLAWAKENGCPWVARTCMIHCLARGPGGAAVGAGARLPVG